MLFAISRKSSLSTMDSFAKLLLVLFATIATVSSELSENKTENPLVNTSEAQPTTTVLNKHLLDIKNSEQSSKYASDMEEFKSIVLEYVDDVLNREKINIVPGVYIQKKVSNDKTNDSTEKKSFDKNFYSNLKEFTDTHSLRIDLARSMSETGRLFFFKGKSHQSLSMRGSLSIHELIQPLQV